MNTITTIASIPKGNVLVLSAPNIQAMISGVYMARFFSTGKIELVYTDNTKEAASFSIEQSQALWDKGQESIFPVVSAVQSKREVR